MVEPWDVAARLNWLLDVAPHAPVPSFTAPDGHLRRANRDIGTELHRRMGGRPAWSWAARVASARKGSPAEPAMLLEIARIFRAPETYFAMRRPDLMRAQADLLDSALAGIGRPPHRRCRQGAAAAAALLEEFRAVLHLARTDELDGAAGPPDRPWSSSSADGDYSCQDNYPTEPQDDTALSNQPRGGWEMAGPLPEGELERLCLDLVSDHQLELPLDAWRLCETMGRARGRRVKVVAVPLGGSTSVGHLTALRRSDKIFYDEAAPHSQQVQIICHEVIHLVRGHLDGREQLTCGALLDDASEQPTSSLYASWQEWEAEVGATFLARLAYTRATPNAPARSPTEVGLAGAFGLRDQL